MQKIYKHASIDKFEAHMVKSNNFVHDEYYVSQHSEEFHMDASFGRRENSKGFRFGVNKRKYRAISMGITVDGSYIGKTSQL